MDMGRNGGLMGHIIVDNGNLIKHQGKELFIMLMGMFIKGNGKMINRMDLVNINIQMGLFIKDNGKMINKMEEVFKYGRMVKNTKVNLIWVLSLVEEYLNLMMDPFMKDIFVIIKYMDKVIHFIFRNL